MTSIEPDADEKAYASLRVVRLSAQVGDDAYYGPCELEVELDEEGRVPRVLLDGHPVTVNPDTVRDAILPSLRHGMSKVGKAAQEILDRQTLAREEADQVSIRWSADELSGRFAEVCDVLERTWNHAPLTDSTGLLHTSDDARAAARRVFELLGIPTATPQEQP
jgi:hypothetical protein